MCLIIVKPEADVISESIIRNAYDHNHNGFGMMWLEEGRVRRIRGLLTLDQILEKYREVQHKSVAMHFRFSTRGTVTENNCHPFRVLNMEEHGRDLYMMHNGTMTTIGAIRAGWSDTREFVDRILRPTLLAEGIDRIKDLAFRTDLGARLTNRNKLFFLDSDGWTGYVNKNEGHTLGDTWFSNVYSLKKKVKRVKAQTAPLTNNGVANPDWPLDLGITEIPAVRRSGYRGRLDPDDIDALQPMNGDRFQLWIDNGTDAGRYEIFNQNEVWEAKQERKRRQEEEKEMKIKRERKARLDRARQAAADELRGITAEVPTPANRDKLRRHWRANAAFELRTEPSTPLPPTGIYGEFGVGDDDDRSGLIDKVLGDSEVEEFGYVKGKHLLLGDSDEKPYRVKITNKLPNVTMVSHEGNLHWVMNDKVTLLGGRPEESSPILGYSWVLAPKSKFDFTPQSQSIISALYPGEYVPCRYRWIAEKKAYKATCMISETSAWIEAKYTYALPEEERKKITEALIRNQESLAA